MALKHLSKSAERWFLQGVASVAEKDPHAARQLVAHMQRLRDVLSTERGVLPGTRKVTIPPLVFTIRARNGVVEIAAIRQARPKSTGELTDLVRASETMTSGGRTFFGRKLDV
ncbi:type II toxin-antitoxin system RelE/ParE family toxin [Sinorhizobium sp. BG8]|uniref:type II toxin-antitoxin system RelE/ParE family toxin n=1 Tax=Sinorhizobium sp. BG8 TaxID=2613773 RepID=UPI00193D25E0|nr:type II toxin-antitoxin system RelE/ParE family toxin [Sinorhizobium sp. BG8]